MYICMYKEEKVSYENSASDFNVFQRVKYSGYRGRVIRFPVS